MIDEDSPLLRLPPSLQGEDLLMLDGIRFAAEHAQLSLDRLKENLWRISFQEYTRKHSVSALLDAWSIVDSADRIRSLVRRIDQEAEGRSELVSRFWESTDRVRHLRNMAQHLDARIPKIVTKGIPLWGSLKWMAWSYETDDIPVAKAGTIHGGTALPTHSMDLSVYGPEPGSTGISHIIIKAVDATVPLLPVVESIRTLVVALENILEEAEMRFLGYRAQPMSDLVGIADVNVEELRRHSRNPTNDDGA